MFVPVVGDETTLVVPGGKPALLGVPVTVNIGGVGVGVVPGGKIPAAVVAVGLTPTVGVTFGPVVAVGIGVFVGAIVAVGVGIGVAVGSGVGVFVGSGVGDGVGVFVGSGVGDGVADGDGRITVSEGSGTTVLV